MEVDDRSLILGPCIAQGTTARIHRATLRDGSSPCAVKLLDAPGPTLRRSAAVAQRTRHPQLVVGAPLASGRGLVLPLIDGPTVAQATTIDLQDLALQAIDLLHHLHARGIVHRDLKPDNLIMADGTLYLLDFGSAVCHPAPLAAPEGSPAYMAPEALLQWSSEPSVDLWALATTLYELRTGRLPFDHGSLPVDLAHKQRPGSWRRVEGDHAAWWNTLFTACFAPHPDDRWSLTRLRRHLGAAGAPRAGASASRSANASGRGAARPH
jgi:serine/threonine protein kinase